MWKVAIIDDDFQVLGGMKKMIPWEQLDIELVGEALDGREGLELVRKHNPDIVITDIYMPIMNGMEMIEQLRKEQFQGKIIILSGYAEFENARNALRLDVEDYLTKPVTLDEIHRLLSRMIEDLEEGHLVHTEHHELKQKLLLYEPFVTKEAIKSIVTGTGIYEAASDILPKPLEWWTERNHLVVGFEVIRTDPFTQFPLSDWNLFRFAIGNIVQEMAVSTWPESRFLELNGQYSILLLHVRKELSESEVAEQAYRLAIDVIYSVEQFLKLKVKVGIGGLKNNLKAIADSTEEAFHALMFKLSSSDSHLPKRISEGISIPSLFLRPAKFYESLSQAFLHFNKDGAVEVVDNYVSEIGKSFGNDSTYLQIIAAELWSFLNFMQQSTGKPFLYTNDPQQLQREMETILTEERLKDWLMEKIEQLFSGKSGNVNAKHKQTIEFIVTYTHENYHRDITLEDLSSKLFISKNYLNQLFKKATGETFTNYLIRVRMEKAKAMIIEGTYLIYEIAEKVGYQNVTYFSTLFKKYNGVNPSELRK